MLKKKMKVALAGYKAEQKYHQEVYNKENAELMDFLVKRGLDVTPVIWNDTAVNWGIYDLVVLKSTWDYHKNIAAFYAWLDNLTQRKIRVLNPVDVVKWNSNKHYLKEIANKHFAAIPSLFLSKGSVVSEDLFNYFGTDNLVLKPCVSAGAENTVLVNRDDWSDKSEGIAALLRQEDLMVQPFVNEIRNGEWSFIFFGEKFSHCILKTPKPGDFRVQEHLGGTVGFPQPDTRHLQQASEYIRSFAAGTLYARVDGVLVNDSFRLMELELIEPYLFFNGNKTLMENYYQALVRAGVH